MNKRVQAYFCLSFAMAIVGSSIVIGKLMVEKIPVFLASGIRFGMASLILILWLYLSEKGFPPLTGKEKRILFFQSFFGVFLFSICLLYGVQYTTASESGIITSTTPMVIGVLAYLFLTEKMTRNIVMGILLAVCGVMVIQLFSGGDGTARGTIPWLGNLLVLLAVVGESLFTILGKMLSERLSPLAISTFVTLIGFFLFLPFAVYEGLYFDFSVPTALDWMYVVYYGVVVTVVAFFLWYKGVSMVSGSVSGVFTSVLPITTLLLSYLLLGEQWIWTHLVGILCVLGGLFATAWTRPEREVETEEKEAKTLSALK